MRILALRSCHGLVLLLLCGLSSAPVLAHAVLLFPVPRSSLTEKTGPCGGEPRGEAPLVVEAGGDLTIRWEEYVDHPGYYQILFSPAGDQDFEVLLDRIPDRKPDIRAGEGTVLYEATVTLPDTPGAACTLQLIQVMTDSPTRPFYYSCADLELVAPRPFRRGDANADGQLNLADAIDTLQALFGELPAPSCGDAADANDDGQIDVSDAIATILHLFRGAPGLPAPGPLSCGDDPTRDGFPPCGSGCA